MIGIAAYLLEPGILPAPFSHSKCIDGTVLWSSRVAVVSGKQFALLLKALPHVQSSPPGQLPHLAWLSPQQLPPHSHTPRDDVGLSW